jgi:ArsR family metal-binding transcriptional regulator
VSESFIGAFPNRAQFEKARAALESLSLSYHLISAEPGFGRVGVPSLVLEEDVYRTLYARCADAFTCAGWVTYRPATIRVPEQEPPSFPDDRFGQTAIMVLAPCVADPARIRLIAHLSGDLTEVFPYVNTEMPTACFNRNGPTFTFMDGHRMISLYPRRITVAKADEIVDAWRTLEAIRCRVNNTWARRAGIAPSYEMREKPPALEIFKRLPRTNCRACGELTCLAFAVKLWSGGGQVSRCQPVVAGAFAHLRPALLEICRGLGVIEDTDVDGMTSTPASEIGDTRRHMKGW